VAPLADELGRLAGRWATWWPGVDTRAMAADVRDRLEQATDAWELGEVTPFGAGEVALVCSALRATAPVVVKVTPRGHPDDAWLRAESEALAFWAPTGAVPRLLGVRDGAATLLMERLRPGTTLDEAALPFAEHLLVLGRLAAQLHGSGPPPDSIPHIAGYAHDWRRALAGEPALLAELDELCAPAPSDVLIHADLHGANALRHGEEWLAIDPHAVRADRNADVWALLDPLVPEVAGRDQAREWVGRYAAAARLDPDRAAAWARLRARAEALQIDAQERPPDGDRAWAERLHRIADALI